MDPNDTLTDPLTGNEIAAADVYDREFGEAWLERDPELADMTLSQFDDARCQDKYGDDSDSSSDD